MALDALTLALRDGSQAKAKLAGFDEDYERANALRTTSDFNQPDRYGQLSTLGVLSDVIGQSQGRKQMRELKPHREAARMAVAENENAPALYQAKVAADKVVRDQTNLENKAAALKQAAALANKQKVDAAALVAEADASKRNEPEAWVNPDGSGIVNGFNTPSGFVGQDGKVADIRGKIPYREYSIATRDAKKGSGSGDAIDPMAMAAKPLLITDILGSDYLEKATGVADIERYAGSYGYGEEGKNIQPLHMKMDDVALDTMKANLEGLGAKPTDKDMEVAFRSVPDKNSQPYTWAVWAQDMYLPMFEKAANRGIEAGTFTPEQKAARMQELQVGIGEAMTKYSPEGEQAPQQTSNIRYPDDPAKQARFEAFRAKKGL